MKQPTYMEVRCNEACIDIPIRMSIRRTFVEFTEDNRERNMNDRGEIILIAKAIQQIQIRLGADFQRTRVSMEAIIEVTPDEPPSTPEPTPLAQDVDNAMRYIMDDLLVDDDYLKARATIQRALDAKTVPDAVIDDLRISQSNGEILQPDTIAWLEQYKVGE